MATKPKRETVLFSDDTKKAYLIQTFLVNKDRYCLEVKVRPVPPSTDISVKENRPKKYTQSTADKSAKVQVDALFDGLSKQLRYRGYITMPAQRRHTVDWA